MKNLKVIMVQRGMNNLELADKTGIDRRTISEYRNLKGNPTLETIKKIAKALGINEKELF